MITDALLAVVFGVWDALMALIGLIPVPSVSDTLGSLFSDLGTVASSMAALGYWIPWSVAGGVIASLWAVYLAVIGIRVVKMIVSLFTGGGLT